MSDSAPLIVDLESGLLRTELAREAFWRAAANGEWRIALDRPARSIARMADADDDEIANLPMNPDVIEAMRRRRAEGGRVVLVAAAPQPVAARFAGALGITDEAYGDVPAGEARAAWLRTRFGDRAPHYVGDDGAAPGVRQAVKIPPPPQSAGAYLKAMRPHQWVKNLLVFLPVVASHKLDQSTVVMSLLAFAAFSLVASSVYLLNDLLDLAADRAHPRKRRRPMASGAVPLKHATLMMGGCLAAGFALALPAGSHFLAVLLGYTVLTTAYSLRLKRVPVLDICVLAALYTLRIVAGAAATGVTLSVWLLAFSIFIFLSLAAIKRQTELIDNLQSGKEKPAGRGYRVGDLPIVEMMAVSAGYVAVLVLALYLNAPTVVALYETPEFLWAVCAVLLYWISRAAMIAHRGEMNDDPIVFAFRDRVSQICGVAVLAALAAAIWS
ncbi:MAG: UbiA family prenyltransferase [Beijerinckiaceae bacterium]